MRLSIAARYDLDHKKGTIGIMDTSVAEKLDAFFANYPIETYKNGELLIRSGEEPRGIFFLKSGLIRQYDIASDGSEIVVNVYKHPSFFPMMWAINKTANQYFFEAARDSVLQLAPPEDVVDFIKSNPDVSYDLLSRLYSGAAGMQRRMAHLMAGNSYTRVLFELVTECRRFGQPQDDGSYRLDIHEDELAMRAGLSRETVNREFAKMKEAGALSISHKCITVHKLSYLESELGSQL